MRAAAVQSYEAFASFYDSVMGDRADHAAYVRGLIERHHSAAGTVLELACGTGSILKQLRSDFEVTGVDLSAAMLAIAAEKVPEARLIQADMTKISLDETFDVVLCVYDSINHLLTFSQWEALFARAREHLSDRGIFIFDINTEYRLREVVAQPQQAIWFGDNLLLMDVVDADVGGVVHWHLQVFECQEESIYQLHSERIPEISFSVERIKDSLGDRFRRIRVYDRQRARPSNRSGRLHFVCERSTPSVRVR
jgi:SAM-dependent methyltransferase